MAHFECAFFLLLGASITEKVLCLDCYSCNGVTDKRSCNQTTICNSNEYCLLDKNGSLFNMRCANTMECSTNGAALIGRDVASRQLTTCHECCSVDMCNRDLCEHNLPSACTDDETVDCAKMNSIFNICQDIHKAKLVCPRFCNLCTIVDGQWSLWTSWSSCDVTCDNGTEVRTRTCTNPAPANGGAGCVGALTEAKSCYLDKCPVHGGWSIWSEWGSCSVTCDVGMQRRHRNCSNPYPSRDGNHCFGDSTDDRLCILSGCVDGNWSLWGAWETCSDSCGGGVKSRERICNNPAPSISGQFCHGRSSQTVTCNRMACPVDGQWSLWSPWSSCDVTCDNGTEIRTRTCTNPAPANGGAGCVGGSTDVKSCFHDECPDGNWSLWGPWGTFSDSCGGGVKSRERTCNNPAPSLSGKFCNGSSIHAVTCNRMPCPENAIAFTAYGLVANPGSELTFSNVWENRGNGYSTSTGRFTCTTPGIYSFSATLTKTYGSYADVVTCFLKINDWARIGSKADPRNNNEHIDDEGGYVISISGTFHLDRNDYVTVGGCNGQQTLFRDHFSSFSGFLVTPDN